MKIENVQACIYGLPEIPEGLICLGGDQERISDKTILKWTGTKFPQPPAIGTKVAVPMNRMGQGVVVSYFIEYGFLGVTAKLDERYRPDWHRKQVSDGLAMVFGVEIDRIENCFPCGFVASHPRMPSGREAFWCKNPQDKGAVVRGLKKQYPGVVIQGPQKAE